MFSIKQTNMILHQSLIKQTRTSDHVEYTRKSQLTEDENKHHENKKRFVWMEINSILGKNGGHKPSSLGGRSIVVVSK